MNNKRENYIDVYRGIGILFMIIGHVYIGYMFDKFSHAFHMPMFFFVTGYFFSVKRADIFFVGKLKTLIVPYFFFGIIDIFVYSKIKNFNSIDMIKHLFWVNTEGLYDVGAVWFLTSLFWATCIYYVIRKIINNKTVLFVLAYLISLVGIISSTMENKLPWAMNTAFVAVGFMHIGYVVRENEKERLINILLNIKQCYLIPFVAVDIILIYTNGYINMRTGEYSNVFLFWLTACLSITILWSVSKLLCNSNNRIIKFISSLLQYVGANSIIFLCLNQIVICILVELLPDFNLYIKKVIVFFCSFIILILLNEIINRTKLKVLIGK